MQLVRNGWLYSVNNGGRVISTWDRQDEFCPEFAKHVIDCFENKSLPRRWLMDYLENSFEQVQDEDKEITYQTPTLDGRLLHFDGSDCNDEYSPLDARDALIDLLNLLL